MDNNFNPLDLSTPRGKVISSEVAPEPTPPQPQVYKVGRGSLLHSPFIKKLVIVLGLALAFLASYVITGYFLNKKVANQAKLSNSSTASTTDSADTSPGSNDDKTTQTDSNQSSTNGNSSSNAATSSPPASAAKTYCGVAGMPEGVCTAITSIEKTGLKGNPYVTKDTSQVPEGSTVQIDEASWKSTGAETGTLNFSAVLGGQNYKGVGSLKVVDGTWKVVDYTLT